jgi:hypothetical protein
MSAFTDLGETGKINNEHFKVFCLLVHANFAMIILKFTDNVQQDRVKGN